jgi:uncharacterized protein (DUF58 family)
VTPRATPLAFAVATLIAWALVLGLLADRAELFVAAVPLAAGLLGVGPRARAPRLELRQEISADRLAEGDSVVVSVHVAASDPDPMIEILVGLPPLIEIAAGSNRVVLAVGPGPPGFCGHRGVWGQAVAG